MLCGTMAGLSLLRARAAGQPMGILQFWRSRILRVAVPCAIAMAVHIAVAWRGTYHVHDILSLRAKVQFARIGVTTGVLGQPDAMLAANSLFIQNVLPLGGALMHTWSIAVQVVFWLLLPVLWKTLRLHNARALALFLVLSGAATAWLRAASWQVATDAPLHSITRALLVFFWYSHAGTRLWTCFAGLAVAHALARARPDLVTTAPAVVKFAQRPLISAAMALAMVLLAVNMKEDPNVAVTQARAVFTHAGSLGAGIIWGGIVFMICLWVSPGSEAARPAGRASRAPAAKSRGWLLVENIARAGLTIYLTHFSLLPRLICSSCVLAPPSNGIVPSPVISLAPGVSNLTNLAQPFGPAHSGPPATWPATVDLQLAGDAAPKPVATELFLAATGWDVNTGDDRAYMAMASSWHWPSQTELTPRPVASSQLRYRTMLRMGSASMLCIGVGIALHYLVMEPAAAAASRVAKASGIARGVLTGYCVLLALVGLAAQAGTGWAAFALLPKDAEVGATGTWTWVPGTPMSTQV